MPFYCSPSALHFFLFLFFFFLFLTFLFLWFYFLFLTFSFFFFFFPQSHLLLSAYALLQPVGAVVTLSRGPVSPREELLHISAAHFYIWWHGIFGCLSGDTPWSPASGGQRDLNSWVSWDCNSWTDSSWQPKTPRALHRPHRSFWERALYIVPGSLAWWSGFWFIGA